MPTYQKFSSDEMRDTIRQAVMQSRPNRRFINYRMHQLLHKYFVYACGKYGNSQLLPKTLLEKTVKHVINRDLLSHAWMDNGRVFVGKLIPTLCTTEAKLNFTGQYLTDLTVGECCAIEFVKYPALVMAYDQLVADGVINSNVLTDSTNNDVV